MIKKIIEISRDRTYLSVKYGQLVLKRHNKPTATIPCEDIGVLLVDNQACVYTHSVFTELIKHKAVVVLCGSDHHPTAIILPVEGNDLQTERYRSQIEATKPLKKRLWQQIVKAKIAHQAKLIKDNVEEYKKLKILQRKVRSGDPDNIESRASKIFWRAFFSDITFKRDINGPPPNNMLNYGYMVLRAAVARAICSAGLLPSIGLHHRNKYNAFCLADDITEPFRGFVEARVKQLYQNDKVGDHLTQDVKAKLLEVLYEPVTVGQFTGPLMVCLHRVCASLYRCFTGQQKQLLLPKL